MKYIIINSFILLFTLTSTAQDILPLETEYTTNFLAKNAYFKDVNGELNKFIGTWEYEDTSTNTIFEITFTKSENTTSIHNCTEDRLTAQFKLSINGIEQYNSYTTDYGKLTIGSGFNPSYTFLPDGNAVRTEPNVNRYHMAIIEPDFIGQLGASNLTIEYENTSSVEKLNWNNEISKAYDYVTNQQVNIYKMPLEMELIKQ